MTALHEARELTVTEATKRGVAGLVADAEQGGPVVVTRHSRPVAAVVPVGRLREIDEAAADLRDLALVLARSAVDSGRRTSFDDVLAAFGHTRESLAAVEDDDPLDG
jgi:prevent-host-death family protein